MSRKRVLWVALVTYILFLGYGYVVNQEARDTFGKDSLIRLRIIANSDTLEDQILKRQIRDKVIALLGPTLKQAKNIEEARVLVAENLDQVTELAQEEIAAAGKDYGVKAALGQYPFPTKSYGEMNFPAGNYEALRMVLGEGKGQNWWCVLFPPLCFVDVRQGLAANTLSSQGAAKMTAKQVEDLPVEVRFKTAELLKKADKQFEKLLP